MLSDLAGAPGTRGIDYGFAGARHPGSFSPGAVVGGSDVGRTFQDGGRRSEGRVRERDARRIGENCAGEAIVREVAELHGTRLDERQRVDRPSGSDHRAAGIGEPRTRLLRACADVSRVSIRGEDEARDSRRGLGDLERSDEAARAIDHGEGCDCPGFNLAPNLELSQEGGEVADILRCHGMHKKHAGQSRHNESIDVVSQHAGPRVVDSHQRELACLGNPWNRVAGSSSLRRGVARKRVCDAKQHAVGG